MLAEAVRSLERDSRAPMPDDVDATAAGREVTGSMETKIIARATAANAAPELLRSIRRIQASATWLVVAFMVVVALLGAGAARASLGVGAESRVNFFLVLGTLLGAQTIVLVVWLALMLWRPSAMGSMSLGGLVRWLVDLIMRRASRSQVHIAALEGATVVHGSPRIARWTLSTLSHGAWFSFYIGCLVTLLALLSARYYTFVWETTILSEQAYAPMVDAIAEAPRALGFPVPSEAQVASSQWFGNEMPAPEDDRETSRAWSGLLVGSIVVYGTLPRLVLLLLCGWRMRAARKAYRLDLNRTGFALLASRLAPRQQSLGVIDPDSGEPRLDDGALKRATPARPKGPPAIVGIEMDQPSVWPPRVHGASLHDLGILNDRPDRQRAIHELHTSAQEPAALVMACSLTSTPDRGLGSIVAQLRSAVSQPAIVLLTGGQSLRERTDAAALSRRIEDWRSLVVEAGVQPGNVLELDLDHATHTSLAKLAELLRGATGTTGAPQHAAPGRHIERAFAVIIEHVEQWGESPGHREQATLQRDILKLYGSEPSNWSTLLASSKSISEMSVDAAKALRTNADRALQLLPPSVRVRPKWAIAGASAGAVGCIAAAMIAAPAAIGALPIWTAIGGAIAAAASAAMPPRAVDDAHDHHHEATADAVRAAALTSLLLELQGRSEQSISQVLERVLSDPEVDEPGPLDDVERVRDWLALVRHRYDLATAEEASS